MLGECRRLFSNARNTAARLSTFNGLTAQPLYHPPPLAGRLRSGTHEDYVLSVGRLETVKRVDLAIRAMAFVDQPTRLVIVGTGTQEEALRHLADACHVADRVEFLDTVDDQRLIDLYASALAVVFAPYDEDYGYVTLEAFLAHRPVVTASDSGGVLEFVEDGVNGAVCDAVPEALATAINRLAVDRTRAAAQGDAGFEQARGITWDGVVEKLVGA